MSKKYVVRDCFGYVIRISNEKPSPEEIKAAYNLAPEASLEYANGRYGWENPETDWCPHCGDPDCYPRVRNGGENCKKEELK